MAYTKSVTQNKSVLLQSATREQIQRHTEQVQKGTATCSLAPCLRCGLASEFFTHHEKRKRNFYIVVEQIVELVIG